MRAIADGDFESAYLIARGPNPLASICGRVCGAPCEASCRRGAIDESVSIRALKRFVTEKFGPESFTEETLKPIELVKRLLGNAANRECSSSEELRSFVGLLNGFADGPKPESEGRGMKVAIIGSGPAGLAAAHDLVLLGFKPTVFEMEPVPAGMLAVGIPEYRLPRDLIKAEVEVIRAMGVEFVCNTQVGKDITLDEIRRDHKATIVAVGAKCSREIPVPGGNGPGILGGVEFLRDVALDDRKPKSTLNQLGQRIVVLGGGNVAYDVSRTVVRQVGYDVSRSALRQAQGGRGSPCAAWRAWRRCRPTTLRFSKDTKEGVQLHPSLGPVEIQREDGAVRGVDVQTLPESVRRKRSIRPEVRRERHPHHRGGHRGLGDRAEARLVVS